MLQLLRLFCFEGLSMKKVLAIASLALLVSSSAFAAKPGETVAGFELGKFKTDASQSINGVSHGADVSMVYEAIKINKYSNSGRFGASAGLLNENKGTDGKFLTANYDFMFYNQTSFTPFVGGTLGYSWNEAEFGVNHNGWLLGPQIGIVYDFSNQFEIEIGGRYLKSTANGSKNVLGNNIGNDVDYVKQYYISVGYKF